MTPEGLRPSARPLPGTQGTHSTPSRPQSDLSPPHVIPAKLVLAKAGSGNPVQGLTDQPALEPPRLGEERNAQRQLPIIGFIARNGRRM
jgi:hypothetical protein